MSIAIPTHRITDHAESGISIRRLTPDIVMPADRPLHRDDYFAFCLLTKGEVSINVDFAERTLTGGHVGCMLPGQVHQYAKVREPEGWMMFVDGIHLGEENLRSMQRFALSPHPLPIDERRTEELNQLFLMLQKRMESTQARDFARVIIDIFAEVMSRNDDTNSLNPRHREVLLRFVQLVDEHVTSHRQPSFYADRLNITTGYLNEILTATIGHSTSEYIQQSIVLRMKRELAYSTQSIQEISRQLGFEDYTYFSRLFSKATGVSPSTFRDKYHD